MVAHETYDTNVDNWCLGVLLYEFLTGKPPFETESQESTYNRIRSLDYTFPDYVPTGARDLIQKVSFMQSQTGNYFKFFRCCV